MSFRTRLRENFLYFFALETRRKSVLNLLSNDEDVENYSRNFNFCIL